MRLDWGEKSSEWDPQTTGPWDRQRLRSAWSGLEGNVDWQVRVAKPSRFAGAGGWASLVVLYERHWIKKKDSEGMN
jgi:hypothetical protein